MMEDQDVEEEAAPAAGGAYITGGLGERILGTGAVGTSEHKLALGRKGASYL